MAKVIITYYRTLEVKEEIDVTDEKEAHRKAEERIGELHNSDYSDINEESYEITSTEIEISTTGLQIII